MRPFNHNRRVNIGRLAQSEEMIRRLASYEAMRTQASRLGLSESIALGIISRVRIEAQKSRRGIDWQKAEVEKRFKEALL